MTYSDPASPPSYFAPPLDDKVNIAERPFFYYPIVEKISDW